MQTSDLAAAARVPVSTIRFYERSGLIPEPDRSSSGYRRYPEATAARVRFIGRAKALGFTLTEIAAFLALSDLGAPPPIDGFLDERLADLDRRIDDLLRVRAALVGLAERPPVPGNCPVIDALGATEVR
ncbi:MerR family transcriptional regulator [Agromyces sp. MMS24-K17]|uniref:MerR family transcriptional regulator n=1 Tax=Agromyces sp. MMS24-K17 TaxID=3372850 RepID=UPI0037545636